MQITKVKVTPVRAALSTPYMWSMGLFEGSSRAIIEIETDQGITGIAEAGSAAQTKEIESLGQRLIGLDPLKLADCERRAILDQRFLNVTGGHSAIKCWGAIDIALWDIKGKVFGLPLYQLLGGAYRKEIAFTEYFGFDSGLKPDGTVNPDLRPEAIAEYCLKMKEEHGSTMFEGKLCTTENINLDLQTIKLIRQAIGDDDMLRLDCNYGYSMMTMKQVLKQVEQYNIRSIEDPALGYDDMMELKRYTSIPFSTHMVDIRHAIAHGGPDAFVITPANLGGVINTIKFIGACEIFNKGCWFYSGCMGIATASYLHFSAAFQHISEPSQSLFRWQKEDIIFGGQFQAKNNVVAVPEGPGLGVAIDPAAMEHLRRALLNLGPAVSFYNFSDSAYNPRLPRA